MTDTSLLHGTVLLGISLAMGCAGAKTSPPANAAEPASECNAGEHKQESCNSCTCSETGLWMCTMKFCATCEPGQDQTCNDNESVSALWGHCDQGQCICRDGFEKNPDTGRCRPLSANPSLPE